MRIPFSRIGGLEGWGPRAAVLPAIGVALLPKCPLCVMLLLGSLGLAHPLHDTVFSALQAATLAGVVILLVVKRRTNPRALLAGMAGVCGIVLASLGLAPRELGYVGAVLLAGAWLVKSGGNPDPSCECAASAVPGQAS